MNKYVWGVVFFMAVFGLWLWTKIQTAGKLVYIAQNPENVNFSNMRINWLQPIEVTNPKDSNISLKEIEFDVKVNDKVLGYGFLNMTLNIKPLEQTIIKVPCSVDVIELVKMFPDVVRVFNGRILQFYIDGNVNADNFKFEIKTQSKLPIPDLTFLN